MIQKGLFFRDQWSERKSHHERSESFVYDSRMLTGVIFWQSTVSKKNQGFISCWCYHCYAEGQENQHEKNEMDSSLREGGGYILTNINDFFWKKELSHTRSSQFSVGFPPTL